MVDPDDVMRFGAAFDMTLTDDEAQSRAAAIDDQVGRFEAIRPSTPDGPEATDVRAGEDEYNAFFRRFDYPGEDGPLSDLEVATKENVAVAGVPMTCGSDALRFVPDYSATVVSRLAAAGADLVGTTNMDEFALFTTGETCAHGRVENPAVPGRVPGGSSAGSGAAVAAGLVDAALGSDTGGSIRIPASFCGVVGLKPTHRSVPRFGFADLAPSLDHVGPLARDVETAARVHDAISGPHPDDPSTTATEAPGDAAAGVGDDVSDLTLGVVEPAFQVAEDPVAETVRGAVEDLELESRSVSLPTFSTPLALAGIIGAEFAALVEQNGQVLGTGTGYADPWREAVAGIDGDELGPHTRSQLLLGKGAMETTDGRVYVASQNARRDFTRQTLDAFEDVDALVSPTTPSTAIEFDRLDDLDDLLETLANTAPWDLTGHPALSVPCGEAEGRPVGLQVTTPYRDERTAVALGRAVESR